MELKIYWTDFAKKELYNIFEYHKKSANLQVAKKIVEGIVKSTFILSAQPYIGTKEPLLEGRKQEFRYLIKNDYKIIYWHNKEKNRIDIADIFDTKRQPIN